MSQSYRTLNHAKFLILYHLIFVVKYRKKLLEKYGSEVKQGMLEIAERSSFAILEMEVDQDHIHLMVESEPKLSPLQIIRRLKQETTVKVWKSHPELNKHFWQEQTFWSDGYFVALSGTLRLKR